MRLARDFAVVPGFLVCLPVAKSDHSASRGLWIGGVVEWLMAPVLKTGEVRASVGSNPTPSVLSLPRNSVCQRGLLVQRQSCSVDSSAFTELSCPG